MSERHCGTIKLLSQLWGKDGKGDKHMNLSSKLNHCPFCHEEEQRNFAGRKFYKELPHEATVMTTLNDAHLQLASDKKGWVLHFEDDGGDRMFDIKVEHCPRCGRNLYNRQHIKNPELLRGKE